MKKLLFCCLAISVLTIGSLAVGRLAFAKGPDLPTTNTPVNTASDEGTFIVHEWGTFTSFSGSDGVFLDFRPLAAEHSDLPGFVRDRASGYPAFSKSRLWGRVRMETPVTYFYTDRVRAVDVRVDFPQGLLTEFYPPVRRMLPAFDPKVAFSTGEPIGNSSLDWGRINLIPESMITEGVKDPALREQLRMHCIKSILPKGANDQHYAQARATDSALVHVRADRYPSFSQGNFSSFNYVANAGWGQTAATNKLASTKPTAKVAVEKPKVPQADFLEKFLFYRGIGKFTLPYAAKFQSSELTFENQSSQPLSSAILIECRDDQIQTAVLTNLGAGQSSSFENRQTVNQKQLATIVQQHLVAEGLYEKEAAAMVATWSDSWFTEQGTRILYMVPADTTEKLLPLHIKPAPHESLRVLVGRMEVMTPESEQQVGTAVAASAIARRAFIVQHKNTPRKDVKPYQIPASILKMGRLAEPALARVVAISTDPAIRFEAKALLADFKRRMSVQVVKK